MSHLFTPMDIDGTDYCVQAATKITAPILSGDTVQESPLSWLLYDREPDPDDPALNPGAESLDQLTHSGAVKFGIQCGTTLNVHVEGNISPYSVNNQRIRILVDGVEEWEYHIGSFTTADPYAAVDAIDENVVIPVSDSPCGHIVEITATTGDEFGHNYIFWRATVAIT